MTFHCCRAALRASLMVALVCGWLLLDSGLAIAQNDDVVAAAETFRAGEAAYGRGDFEAAARAFEVSNRLAPHPNTIYNAGLAWQAAGKGGRAADALASTIASGGLSEQQHADASSRLDALRKSLGWARIEAPEGTVLSLAHAQGKKAPAVIHVTPGKHEVKAVLPDGRSEVREVQIAAGRMALVSFMPSASLSPDHTPSDPTPVEPPSQPFELGDLHWIGGWVAVGVSAASGIVAIGLGVAALDARDKFDESGHTDRDAHDRADKLRTATNVMWVTAALVGAAGVVLLVTAPHDDDEPPAGEATLRLGPGTFSLNATF